VKPKGIVLSGPDKTIQAKAKQFKLPITVDLAMPLAFDKTLFVEPGTGVPWDLLPAAWHFLERWDAAAPLWRYGVNAADVGTPGERTRTQKVIRDLRVLLHAVELLFVRDNEAGRALMGVYRQELSGRGEKRLAFLRALYQIKPRLCVLPRSWLAEVQQRVRKDAQAARGRRRKAGKLVTVEIAPGRFVKCHAGDEARVREQFAQRQRGRRRHG
jgi:hypothetical protein